MKKLKSRLAGIICIMLAMTVTFTGCSISESDTSDSTSGGSSVTDSSTTDSSTEDSSVEDSSADDSSTEDSSTGDSSTEDSSAGDSSTEDSSAGDSSAETPIATGISLNYSAYSLDEGESFTLTATVEMSDGSAYSDDINWACADTSVAAITPDGSQCSVYAEGEGQTTVTATAGEYSAECTVTVTGLTVDSIITSAGGYEESLFVTWETSNPYNDTIRYRLSGESSYTTFTDSNLITAISSTEARSDIVGLESGEYDIQIISGGTYCETTVTVSSYDRSGYAHFNYSDGIGAYNDDGTLKDNSVVIYLTDSNKNDIIDYVYNYKNGSFTKLSANTVKGWFSSSADGYGIGYFLNNNTYSGGIGTVTDTYSGVVIRVIGTVNAEVTGDGTASEIDGLRPWVAASDSDGDGELDKDGDNGRYASIVDAKNLTIEGIGEDATIRGWGFSFAAKTSGYGYGFEVRNITFTRYSEDAIGMEGQADGTTITVPVQRCWIHNNSFYVGYCEADSSVELDKGDGDGSCDFKRGEYFTFSYNYLEGCHKTNLIGASDTCPQYNITIHHNYYKNCSARMPLIRMANLHYYNNYVYGAGQSAISSRGNNYTYSEYNYYENNYVAIEVKSSAAVKSYGDVFVTSDSSKYPNSNAATVVASRTQSVTNTCYDNGKGIDYSSFDTSTTLFYYDDYKLTTDASAAKAEVIKSAGVHSSESSSSGSQTTGTDVAINISDIGTGTLADGYELGTGVYICCGTSGLTIDTSNKSYGDTTYSCRLKTGSNVNSAAIKIVAEGACTVTVHVTTSNGKDDKLVGLFNSQDTSDLYGSTQSISASSSMPIYELTFEISSAGTYYLGNGTSSGGINIYYIAVKY